jgi:hypothetical protein
VKHDLRAHPTGDAAERFRAWLESETIDTLRRSYGDAEQTKSAIFLFANRAYEAHMTNDSVDSLFARCIVRAGFQERDEAAAFAWLDQFGAVAANVHA